MSPATAGSTTALIAQRILPKGQFICRHMTIETQTALGTSVLPITHRPFQAWER